MWDLRLEGYKVMVIERLLLKIRIILSTYGVLARLDRRPAELILILYLTMVRRMDNHLATKSSIAVLHFADIIPMEQLILTSSICHGENDSSIRLGPISP